MIVLRVGLGPAGPGWVLIFFKSLELSGSMRLYMPNSILAFLIGSSPDDFKQRSPSTLIQTVCSSKDTKFLIKLVFLEQCIGQLGLHK